MRDEIKTCKCLRLFCWTITGTFSHYSNQWKKKRTSALKKFNSVSDIERSWPDCWVLLHKIRFRSEDWRLFTRNSWLLNCCSSLNSMRPDWGWEVYQMVTRAGVMLLVQFSCQSQLEVDVFRSGPRHSLWGVGLNLWYCTVSVHTVQCTLYSTCPPTHPVKSCTRSAFASGENSPKVEPQL